MVFFVVVVVVVFVVVVFPYQARLATRKWLSSSKGNLE